jgi:hypothetical protein
MSLSLGPHFADAVGRMSTQILGVAKVPRADPVKLGQ